VGRVSTHCTKKKYRVKDVLQEVGSGMSDTRPKLHRLIKLVNEHQVDVVVIEHKDRLCRFNFGLLESYFASHGVRIEWVRKTLGKSYEEELVSDILSLMSSFSARIYGKRSAANRKRKAEAG
jgi:predicted site-specific integrase-resolvase